MKRPAAAVNQKKPKNQKQTSIKKNPVAFDWLQLFETGSYVLARYSESLKSEWVKISLKAAFVNF